MQRILPALAVLLLLTSCSNRNVADYEIKASGNGKLHPIIKIYDAEKGGACTAFVISDTVAMTAAHCVERTEEFMKVILPKMFANSNKKIAELRRAIADVKVRCSAPAPCEMIAAQFQGMIDAELAGQKVARTWKTTEYVITDSDGNDLKIKAIAIKQSYQRDYAFIKGDFSKFNKLRIKKTFGVHTGDNLRACGFPGAKVPAVCIDFEAVSQKDFMYTGRSMFVPGISGGPVIDADGEVVGICSRVQGDVSIFEPTLGTVDDK